MRSTTAIAAAGLTNPGLLREVNEDRFHVDVARGVFAVVDGVGGQAAGGRAADVALTMLQTRLERETGPVSDRIRESITIANNEIHRVAASRPEWNGMACVLTVAIVQDGQAVIGHVGDTRLYKLRQGRIEKITRDHSPIGEREDANELSEADAMRHPRRNEVYRDVGSERHEPRDPDFVDIQHVSFEPDAALLLCSDGLTDLVASADIRRIVKQFAGNPDAVVRALVAAANAAGGKDNVTAVYVEGERFAAPRTALSGGPAPQKTFRQVALVLAVALSVILVPADVRYSLSGAIIRPVVGGPGTEVVYPSGSINAAIARAQPLSQVIVEPGEYREQLRLREGVRVVSRIPRGATIRLPAGTSEERAAVVATGLTSAELVGFRIVGDAATPLGTGLLVRNSSISIVDVEITGATRAAIDFAEGAGAGLVASEIHDNPGAALTIGPGASPRIAHNTFLRNGSGAQSSKPLIIERGAVPRFQRNVFHGVRVDALGTLDDAARLALMRDNWFLGNAHVTNSTALNRAGERGR